MQRIMSAIKMGDELSALLDGLSSSGSGGAAARRAAEVERLWKEAVERVYGEAAPMVLFHTNAVYVLRQEGSSKLVVYIDDSVIKSDVDLRQEQLKLAFYDHGESIGSFVVSSPKMGMRKRRPFSRLAEEVERDGSPCVARPLAESEEADVVKTSERISDKKLKEAFRRAMRCRYAHTGTEGRS